MPGIYLFISQYRTISISNHICCTSSDLYMLYYLIVVTYFIIVFIYCINDYKIACLLWYVNVSVGEPYSQYDAIATHFHPYNVYYRQCSNITLIIDSHLYAFMGM